MWTPNEIEHVLEGVSRLGWLVLKRFSALYQPTEVLAAFTCLPRRDFDTLRHMHFVLSEDARQFLEEALPSFLRSAPSATTHIVEDKQGLPRGKIDWSRTVIRQTIAGGDPTRFVTRSIDRTSDTAEARLLLFMTTRLLQLSEGLLKRSIPLLAQSRLEQGIEHAKRSAIFLRTRGVRSVHKISVRDIAPLRRSRRADVIAGVRLYDLYINVVELANENLLRSLLRQKQMAPEDHDDLFEIWALLTLVEVHLSEGWELKEALLIGGDGSVKRPKFRLAKGGAQIELFYQTIPPEMAKSSAYKAIFAQYDLDASMRRPDITLKLTTATGDENRLFFEVKRTRDAGYILDSVYKVLGYLSDFKEQLGPNQPMAFLIVWAGIEKKAGNPVTLNPVQILTAEELVKLTLPY